MMMKVCDNFLNIIKLPKIIDIIIYMWYYIVKYYYYINAIEIIYR